MQTVDAIVDADGRIKVLGDVRLPVNRRAILTVLDEESPDGNTHRMDKLVEAFKNAQKANLFSDIEDPSEWQRKLRDEWE